jgi:hypothetical protein
MLEAGMSSLAVDIEAAIRRSASLDDLSAILRAYRQSGGSQAEAQQVLEELRGHLDEELEDRLLEALDIVVGWCHARFRVWE